MANLKSDIIQRAVRVLEQGSSLIKTDPANQKNQQQNQDQNDPQTFIYIVLGLLIAGFLFFVINTIRCYLTRPREADFEDEDMMEQQIGSTELGHGSPTDEQNKNKAGQRYNK